MIHFQLLGSVPTKCNECQSLLKLYQNSTSVDGLELRCTSRKCRKRHRHRPEVLQNLKGTITQNHKHLYLCHLGLSRDARMKFLGVTEGVATEMKKRYRNKNYSLLEQKSTNCFFETV